MKLLAEAVRIMTVDVFERWSIRPQRDRIRVQVSSSPEQDASGTPQMQPCARMWSWILYRLREAYIQSSYRRKELELSQKISHVNVRAISRHALRYGRARLGPLRQSFKTSNFMPNITSGSALPCSHALVPAQGRCKSQQHFFLAHAGF